ncbi:MAG: hypothetical protein OXE98_02825 [Hyphomicrobiales bacterium]|nr:hypothetical protein [Hyphomicrobiales bacterium]
MPSKIPGHIRQIRKHGLAAFLRQKREKHKRKRADKRKLVLDHLLRIHQERIAYGPFKGMEVSPERVSWGDGDLTTKILGVYEKVVLEKIVALSKDINGPLIDVGASDGYYVIGATYSGLFQQAHAFEINPKGQEATRRNADINGVADKVHIHGRADREEIKSLITPHRDALVLIDIEGAEFDLLDADMLETLRECTLIIESHPPKVEDGFEREKEMLEMASKHFEIEKLKGQFASPNEFDELDDFSDYERLMAFSENRGWAGYWFLMTPRRTISS